jgi:hypothetical protein
MGRSTPCSSRSADWSPDVFTGRSVAEVVVLLFTITACASILLTGAAIAAIVLFPGVDQDAVELAPSVDFLQTTVGLIIGALLGMLAKRRDPDSREEQR